MKTGGIVMARDKYDPYWMVIGRYVGKTQYGHEIELPSKKRKTYNHVEPLDIDRYFEERFEEN